MKEKKLPEESDSSYENKLEAFKIEELEHRIEFKSWLDSDETVNYCCRNGFEECPELHK